MCTLLLITSTGSCMILTVCSSAQLRFKPWSVSSPMAFASLNRRATGPKGVLQSSPVWSAIISLIVSSVS